MPPALADADGRLQIGNEGVLRDRLHHRHAAGSFVIPQHRAGLDPVEHRGRDREIARLSVNIRDMAQMRVEAEYLLQYHHPTLRRSGRMGDIGAKLVAVGCDQRLVAHGIILATL